MPDLKNISISTGSMIRVIVILLVLGFVYLVKDVLVLLFVAIILSAAFDPMVDWLQTKKIPRALSILGVYIIFIGLVATIIYSLAGPVKDQILDIARDANTAQIYQKVDEGLRNLSAIGTADHRPTSSGLSVVISNLSKASSGIFNFIISLFGGVVSFFIVLVMTFYLVVEEEGMKRFIRSLTPDQHQPYVTQLVKRIQERLAWWLRGQLILSLIVFFLVYLGLTILGVKYALLLALVAGIFEIIPYLGPTLSAIPAVFFAFLQKPSLAVFTIILYVLIQQAENHLIVPKVMGKVVGLNPLVVILSILIGARLAGALGALLAVPVVTALAVYVEDLLDKQRAERNKLA